MATLQFLSWCRIDKSYTAGDVAIIPFDRGSTIEGCDEITVEHIRAILASYKDLEGQPINKAALVKLADRDILSDLNDDELTISRECIEIACFCGLANRDLFGHWGSYCNSDCFVLYTQNFPEDPSFIGVISRRRVGRNIDGRSLAETTFTIPVHVSSIGHLRGISLDANLLSALINYRNSSSEKVWSRWQNSISCFNQANTDSDTVREQMEWIHLASAFEYLLDAASKAEDVAQKFSSIFIPHKQLQISAAKRRVERWKDPNSPLRYEWMREFYRIRGSFAHGRLQASQPVVWKPLEHIVLAAIAFPLVVRLLLAKEGVYSLTNDDYAQIDAFESVADIGFLTKPPDQRHSNDCWWDRLVYEAKMALGWRKHFGRPEPSSPEDSSRET